MVGLEEQRKKKHTAEEKEEGGWGYWEGAVACVLFAHTVVDADLEKRKNINPENQIRIEIVLRLSSEGWQTFHKKTLKNIWKLTEWVPVLVKHSLSAVLPTFGTNPHERWTRTSSSTEEKNQLNSLILGGFLDKLRKIQILH